MIMMRTSASDLRGIIMLGAFQMTYVGYSDISRWCGGSDLEFTRYKHIRTPERPTAPFLCPYCWTSPIKVDSPSCTFRSGTILWWYSAADQSDVRWPTTSCTLLSATPFSCRAPVERDCIFLFQSSNTNDGTLSAVHLHDLQLLTSSLTQCIPLSFSEPPWDVYIASGHCKCIERKRWVESGRFRDTVCFI